MNIESVKKLTAIDLEAATTVMAAAFFCDPLWTHLFENSGKRKHYLDRFFNSMLKFAIANGTAYGVGDPLKGVAIWELGKSNAKFSDMSTLLGLAISPFIVYMAKALPVFRIFGQMKKKHALKPYWYLQSIGVHPCYQGKGYSKQLIEPILALAEKKKVNIYTETMTPSNVGLYSRFGFSVMEERCISNSQLKVWSFYIKNTD